LFFVGMIEDTLSAPLAAASHSARAAERVLVERARTGDHEAFALLVERRLTPTLRSVAAVLGDEADALDVTQRIFLQAWRQLPSLRAADAFPAWFGRIVVNAARSAMRERRRRRVREISVSELADGGESLVTTGIAHEDQTVRLDQLERALERITPAERMVLWLHHYEGLPLVAIAGRLGVPPRTVKSRLFTARRALSRALAVEDAQ
jgi:RNA polymerase sigma-70 factor (ECF subfamily)